MGKERGQGTGCDLGNILPTQDLREKWSKESQPKTRGIQLAESSLTQLELEQLELKISPSML